MRRELMNVCILFAQESTDREIFSCLREYLMSVESLDSVR